MATEFIVMLGASIAIGIILIALMSYFYKDQREEQNIIIAKDVLTSVENELFVATKVLPGYQRVFEVPATLNNEEYTIAISGQDIILTYKGIDFIAVAPNMTGQIQKEENTVRNIDGRVCINQVNC